jgi:hypothetical protein
MPKAQTRYAGKTHGKDTHGIVLDEQSQEQPSDKDRARSAAITEEKEDELQPLKEKSGF